MPGKKPQPKPYYQTAMQQAGYYHPQDLGNFIQSLKNSEADMVKSCVKSMIKSARDLEFTPLLADLFELPLNMDIRANVCRHAIDFRNDIGIAAIDSVLTHREEFGARRTTELLAYAVQFKPLANTVVTAFGDIELLKFLELDGAMRVLNACVDAGKDASVAVVNVLQDNVPVREFLAGRNFDLAVGRMVQKRFIAADPDRGGIKWKPEPMSTFFPF